MVKSGWAKLCRKGCESFKPGGKESSTTRFLVSWERSESAIGSVSDQKSSEPEDVVKVACSGWGECLCLSGPREGHSGRAVSQPEATERVSAQRRGLTQHLCEAPVDARGQEDASAWVSFWSSVVWTLLCICSEKETEDSREG